MKVRKAARSAPRTAAAMAMPVTAPPRRPLGHGFAEDGVVRLGWVVVMMVEAPEGFWGLVDWETMILCRPRAPNG